MLSNINISSNVINDILAAILEKNTTLSQKDLWIKYNDYIFDVFVKVNKPTINLHFLALDIQKVISFFLDKQLDLKKTLFTINVHLNKN